MHKRWLIGVAVLFCVTANAQVYKNSSSTTITVSGTSGTTPYLTDNLGTLAHSVSIAVAGSPSALTVTVQGCRFGTLGTSNGICDTVADSTNACPSATLQAGITYTATSSGNACFQANYDYYIPVATWSGGTNVSVTISLMGNVPSFSSGGGGSDCSPDGSIGDLLLDTGEGGCSSSTVLVGGNGSTGSALTATGTGAAATISVTNDSSGNGVKVTSTGSGDGIYSTASSTADAAQFVSTGSGEALVVQGAANAVAASVTGATPGNGALVALNTETGSPGGYAVSATSEGAAAAIYAVNTGSGSGGEFTGAGSAADVVLKANGIQFPDNTIQTTAGSGCSGSTANGVCYNNAGTATYSTDGLIDYKPSNITLGVFVANGASSYSGFYDLGGGGIEAHDQSNIYDGSDDGNYSVGTVAMTYNYSDLLTSCTQPSGGGGCSDALTGTFTSGVMRGLLTITGGSLTTGTIATVTLPLQSTPVSESVPTVCFPHPEGAAALKGIAIGTPSGTAGNSFTFTVTATVSVATGTLSVGYECFE
jgi:hypothetical protein